MEKEGFGPEQTENSIAQSIEYVKTEIDNLTHPSGHVNHKDLGELLEKLAQEIYERYRSE